MNERMKQGIELENRMADLFMKAGWECEHMASNMPFDITLKKEDIVYGYVETYICKNPRILKEKVERIQKYLDEIKPKLFILTDGISFETYFDGVYFSTTTIPVGYYEFSQMNRLMTYAKKIKEMHDGKSE